LESNNGGREGGTGKGKEEILFGNLISLAKAEINVYIAKRDIFCPPLQLIDFQKMVFQWQ
jgi:hypothetical protein